jgi:hypothetical protein
MRTILFVSLWLAAGCASAAEAGKVIFVAGEARADARPLALGAAINEGELLSTGADGYVYIKTLDDGLFILRPKTQARIAAYHVDKVNPANTRVKLELLSGVARTQSGKAVKLARQNFRFNTPVAAIGVRGTDFTVFTDDQTSRVAVLSGGITISGFSGACMRDGSGPCEGAASRELSASQKGQLLQIRRGQSAAQLVAGGVLSPDTVAPPRPDEPIAKAGTPGAGNAAPDAEPYIAPQKVAVLQEQVKTPAPPVPPQNPQNPQNPQPEQPPVTGPVLPPVVVPEVPVTPPVVVNPLPDGPGAGTGPLPDPVLPPAPARVLTWGRFAAIADRPAQLDLAEQMNGGAKRITQKGDYALLRDSGEFTLPERGSVGFELQRGEATIFSDNPTVKPVQASLENGQLRFDFDKRKFATSFDLVNGAERINMVASGLVAGDGRFSGAGQFAIGNNMNVDGVLGGRNAESAAYLFQGRLSGDRDVFGGTTWGKAPQ